MPHRRLFHFFPHSISTLGFYDLGSISSAQPPRPLFPPFSFLFRTMDPTSFYFIPLLPSFVKHSSNHRVQQMSFERSLGTREGLVEDFRAVYAIVQFSWIILFDKFQRNLFQRGVSPVFPSILRFLLLFY